MRKKSHNYLFYLYIYFNIVFIAYFYQTGKLSGDFFGYILEGDEFAKFLTIAVIEIILISFFYFILVRVIIPNSVSSKVYFIDSVRKKIFLLLLFFLQIAKLVYSYKTNVGVLLSNNHGVIDVGPLKYFFTIFDSDSLAVLVLFIFPRGKLLFLNAVVFLLSNYYRGWIAGASFQLIIILIGRFFYHRQIKLQYIIYLMIFVFAFSPAIYYLKYLSRLYGINEFDINDLLDYYEFERYKQLLEVIFSRFQHVSEVFMIFKNIDFIRISYSENQFIPFYFDNIFKRHLSSAFDYNMVTFGEFAAFHIKNVELGNIHVGIQTWLILKPATTILYVLFFILSTCLITFLLSKITSRMYKSVICYIWLFYFMHGWFSTYFAYIISILVLFIYFRLTGKRQCRL